MSQLADFECSRRWIAAEQRREEERQRGAAARPPAPGWVIEQALDGHSPAVYVHIGGCHMTGKRCRGVQRDQALRALVDGVDACPYCRPGTELGVLD
ncbi:DUF6233 domain-containing protein [Streptomyces sp. NPDC097610]|uniref:DUF6233 domain-containing protein n=1 Tax=Streptomyces sp. NPDC097610 TaxID=3157227 RepID=UPI003323D60B